MPRSVPRPPSAAQAPLVSAPPVPADGDLPQVEVSWNPQGCEVEMSGLVTRSLLDHARDLVYAQTRPGTCLTVRLSDAVVTRELVAMLIGARNYLTRSGSRLVVDAPGRALPPALLRALSAPDDASARARVHVDAS